jgi:hypothetical protein
LRSNTTGRLTGPPRFLFDLRWDKPPRDKIAPFLAEPQLADTEQTTGNGYGTALDLDRSPYGHFLFTRRCALGL